MLCDRDGVRHPPWFKVFQMDIIGRKEGRRLSDAELGMMMRIRCELAASVEDIPSLPANPDELAAELGRNPDDVRRNLTPSVLIFFRVEGGRIFDDELVRQRNEAKANREGRVKGAEVTNAKKSAGKAQGTKAQADGDRDAERHAERGGERHGERRAERGGQRDGQRTLPSIQFPSIPSSSVMASKGELSSSAEVEEEDDQPDVPRNSQRGHRPAVMSPAGVRALTKDERVYAEDWIENNPDELPKHAEPRRWVTALLAERSAPQAPGNSQQARRPAPSYRPSAPQPTKQADDDPWVKDYDDHDPDAASPKTGRKLNGYHAASRGE